MKKITTSIKIIAALLPAIIIINLSSCKKDLNTEDIIVYTPTGSIGSNALSGGSAVTLRNKVLSSSYIGFPALLTKAFTSDVNITATIDTSQVSIYNKINKTNYPALPDGAFTLGTKGTVTIQSGLTQSKDSIQVQVADASKLKFGTNSYLIPVVFKNADAGIAVSNTRQVMYVQLSVTSVAYSIADLSGKSQVDIVLKRAGNTTVGTNLINLKGLVNSAIAQPVNVTVITNAALIDDFNKKNNTTYKAFPAGAFSLIKDNTVIPANATTSTDNLQVQLSDLSLFAIDTDYLLPIQIKDNSSADSPPVDAGKNVVYLHVSVLLNNIDLTSKNAVSGTLVNRANPAWTVVAATDAVIPGLEAINVLDANNSTSWLAGDGGQGTFITLDMAGSNTIKGFTLVPVYYYGYTVYNATEIEVRTSSDNINWKSQGTYTADEVSPTSSETAPDYRNINFYNPVTCRYVKFILKTLPYYYGGFSEINAIK